MQASIHSPRRADERLARKCGTFDVAGNADELLVQGRIIGERRESKPQLDIALCIGSARIEAAGRGDGHILPMAADQRLRAAPQNRCLLGRENGDIRSTGRRCEAERLRRPAVEIPRRDDALVDLKLEQRTLRGVIELPVDRAAIVILLRERLLRGADSVRGSVDRERVRRSCGAAATEHQPLLELNREGSACDHANVARLRQQIAQRSQDSRRRTSFRTGSGDRRPHAAASTDQHDARIGIGFDLTPLVLPLFKLTYMYGMPVGELKTGSSRVPNSSASRSRRGSPVI